MIDFPFPSGIMDFYLCLTICLPLNSFPYINTQQPTIVES